MMFRRKPQPKPSTLLTHWIHCPCPECQKERLLCLLRTEMRRTVLSANECRLLLERQRRWG